METQNFIRPSENVEKCINLVYINNEVIVYIEVTKFKSEKKKIYRLSSIILKLDEFDDLHEKIELSKNYKFEKYKSNNKKFVSLIDEILESL